LQLQAGEGLAIIGPSASGKSSLARAIVNIWDVARGEIRIDGASYHQWEADKLGKFIGYLPQDVSLFAGTIAQNIARFEEELSSEKIILAAKLARVHDMIMSFQSGYDTELGEGGAGLSQGQRQRIALARAIYNNPFLVVLDEPNANLDVEGEKALTECILDLRKMGSIVIVVAHRPSAVVALDLVAIVQKGKIMKFGPKDKVLGKPGTTSSPSISPISPPPMKPITIYNNNPSLQ
jgi:ATP-binding cassette, subfamily C, bacterial PrsD